jgi:hypothetical protein
VSHVEAAVAALNAALPLSARAYDLDDLDQMAELPAMYVEVTVSRRYGGDPRNAGGKGRTGWRVGTRFVAQRQGNAEHLKTLVTAALEEVRLTVSDQQTTPIKFESAEVIGPDDGWFSGLTLWTYAL